jgi:hypothetical protein
MELWNMMASDGASCFAHCFSILFGMLSGPDDLDGLMFLSSLVQQKDKENVKEKTKPL